jgi:Ca2+-transporting ATPase
MPASITGLADAEARRRLAADGPNELPKAAGATLGGSRWRSCASRCSGLLLAGGAVYVALGDLLGGVVLLVFASLSVSISIVQEIRSERVLDALRAMTSPRAW